LGLKDATRPPESKYLLGTTSAFLSTTSRLGSGLVINRHGLASALERCDFRLTSMTVQSSFLIRCALCASGDPTSGKAYYIQHVQTGAEFRSGALSELIQWVADQNLRYLSDVVNKPSFPNAEAQEDLQ
jgi:hypothetical protein